MPVQRKVFRIEEHGRRAAADAAPSSARPNFMNEVHATRQAMQPRAQLDRDAMTRAQAQVAEAQAFKSELVLIHAAVERTREQIATLDGQTPATERTSRAGRELAAIVGSTEHATQSILQAAEQIDHAAHALSATLKSSHEQGLAQDIQDRVVQVFEACNFQDLTGQRVTRVIEALSYVEEHIGRLLMIWKHIEQDAAVVPGEGESERRFLNGPKLPGDAGHSSQDDIDSLFRRA